MIQDIAPQLGLGATLLGLLSFGCAFAPEHDSTSIGQVEQGVIFGENDLITVSADGGNVPSKYRDILDGFGRSITSGALCTATHVGNGIVVSAGHCFGAGPTRENNLPCPDTQVAFGYRSGNTSFTANCQEMLAQQTGNGKDYAIYRVSPVPPVTVPVNLNARPTANEPLTIFSHPGGRPLEWSQVCTVKNTRGSTEFQYECDTQGGSSGATVLHDTTLQVVGIHWGVVGLNTATNLADTPLSEFINTPTTPTTPAGPRVQIVSKQSAKCLDVYGAGTANGTNIDIWTCHGGNAQTFRMEDIGSGNVRFVNVASNKCLDVSGGSTARGANIQLWQCNGSNAQSFWLNDAGGGYSGIINTSSGRAFDVEGQYTANGTNVHQWDYRASGNQIWKFENLGCSGITFYQHTNYGGYAVTLPPGNYDLADMTARGIENDDVSSVRVPDGCSTILYQDAGYGGSVLNLSADDPSLVDNGWNDSMSSVVVK